MLYRILCAGAALLVFACVSPSQQVSPDVQAAVLRFPAVDRVLRDPVLPAHILHAPAPFYLPQRFSNLRFRVLASAHSLPLSFVLNRTSIRTDRGAHVK